VLQISPLSTNPNASFVDLPVKTGSTQMPLCSLEQLRSKFLHPSEHRRSASIQAPFGQQISDILIGRWKSQIHLHSIHDNGGCKPMAF